MRRALLVALLAFALLLPPGGHAQVPGNPVCSAGNFLVSRAAPTSVQAGQAFSITITVSNNGQVPATVNVSGNVATPGWRFTSGDSKQQDIQQGAAQQFLFQVVSDPTVTQDADVNFAGAATCGSSSVPVPCPNGACTVQLPAQTVHMQLQQASGFRIPGLTDLNFPIEYLIAGIVLVAVLVAIPLALRGRKKRAAPAMISCPEPLKPIKAGRGASFPIEVRNATDAATKLALEVGAVPEGWSAFLPLPDLQLAPKETRGLWLMVRSPPEARSGDAAEIEVKATDEGGRASAVKVRAEIMPGGEESAR